MRNVLVGLVALVVGCTPALDSYNERLEKQREAAQEAKDALDRLAIAQGNQRAAEDLFAGLLSPEETERQRDLFADRVAAIDQTIEATQLRLSEHRERLSALRRELEEANRELADAAMAGIPPAQATISAQAEASQRINETERQIEQARLKLRRLRDEREGTLTQLSGATSALGISRDRQASQEGSRKAERARLAAQ